MRETDQVAQACVQVGGEARGFLPDTFNFHGGIRSEDPCREGSVGRCG